MAGTQVRRRVHDARERGGLLGELIQRRGLLEHLVVQGPQSAARVGAQTHPLDGRRAVSDQREQLLTSESDPDRAIEHPGCHGRQHSLRAGAALGPEPPADVLGDDTNSAVLEPEKLERLIFLHQEYAQEVAGRVQELDEEDKAENDDDDDEVNPEDKEYLDLLEHGLDKLQKIDVVLARLLSDRTILDESGSSPATRVKQLCLNGGGSTILDDVRKEVADYAEKLVVLNASQEVDEEQTAEIKANLVRFALFEV